MKSSLGQVQPFKSQLMVQRQERVECSLWGEEELLWQVKEVKYLGVLFMSAEKVEREIDKQTGVQSPVEQKPYWSDAVHRRIGQEAKPLICQSIYVHIQPVSGD